MSFEDTEYEENLSGITKDTILIRTIGGSRTVHAIDCDYIKDWNINGCIAIDKFNPKLMSTCAVCERSVYTSIGAKDYTKNRKKYEEVFQKNGIQAATVKDFYRKARAKTQFRENILYVESKKEEWKIEFLPNDDVKLFHNNYQVRKGNSTDRIGRSGYHEHTLHTSTKLYEAMRQIINYNYEKAENKHKVKRKKPITFRNLTDDDLDEVLY